MKRVFAGGDLHCGHRAGLTPPQHSPGDILVDKWAKLRHDLWNAFADKVDELRPFDIGLWNADLIDGRGGRSGGTEIIQPDRFKQCDIARDVIDFVRAEKNVITRGTPYHTGDAEDYEDLIAEKVNAIAVKDQVWIDVNGVIFDVKHHISNTSIPHGKGTPISRERLWNLVHNDFIESQPLAHIILRSHVHWYFHAEDVSWHGFVLPSLQGLGSKYGSRQVSSIVHFGFMWFDIEDLETWIESPSYHRWILAGATQKKKTLIL